MSDFVLFCACLFILAGSIFISFKTGFIQLRFLPALLKKGVFRKGEGAETISPLKALFTAMSTTLGISTIVGPVIAIYLGGPGALIGFLFTSFFGSAATYLEVGLAVEHRKRTGNGTIMGGPMQYMERLFSNGVAKWYAVCCLLLMTAWSGAQSNQLAAILNSPLLGEYRIPTVISGVAIAALVLTALMGGIKRVSAFSAKLVPSMFVLYIGSSIWIALSHVAQWGDIFAEIFRSAWEPQSMGSGIVVGGLISTLRWGIFKGTQACEAGIGTQAIPHSMAETKDPEMQGALAMLSTYTAGIVAFLSGFVALITKTWQDPQIPLGISMVAKSFQLYFSSFGVAIIALSTLLFGFGTILGNSYNGGQCFSYLTQNRKPKLYLLGTTIMVFVGAIAEVKMFWSLMDYILAAMAIPHMGILVWYAARQRKSITA